MKKRSFLMSNKLLKNTTFLTVLFVSIALISSSSLSANLSNISETKDSQLRITEREIPNEVKQSAGLAPNVGNKNCNKITKSVPSNDIMYGYIANSSTYDEGPCYFYLDDPGTIEFLQETESDDFLSGGTGTTDERWLAVEYGNGALWDIDWWDTGDMTLIGGGGASLNGLTWDPIWNRLYGASGSKLYEIDPDTGEQEWIGSFGSGVNEMIAIASNMDGVMYGWDLGDKLWTIDTETGEATEVGSLGIDLNYAQDGGFDWETGYLWLSAYTVSPNYGSYLYICDEETAECTPIGQIEDNSQITASFVSFCYCPGSDVGVKNINYPESGNAVENIPMQVTVKNYGPYTETFDAQMEVCGYEDGDIILEEDFSGSFPPEGWSTDWWEKSNTSYACGEPPEAMCNKYTQYNQGDYYDNYIATKSMNCSDIEAVELSFKLTIDTNYMQYCYFHIKFRKDSNSPWKEITPWDNPIPWDIDCEPFWITIYGDPFLGEEFQVKWEYIGYYYYFNNIYLDDVKIQELNGFVEYAEIVEDITLEPGEEEIVDFPTWTPSYWQDPEYENIWQEFPVKAFTLLHDDYYPDNDCKEKIVNLYFPWFHDIEITSIDSPCEDGPGKKYPVKATIKNVGQYADCCISIDISINEVDSEPEYSDNACQGDYIEPGESKTFDFDDWTPDYLQYETSGSKDYIIHAEINMAGDKNPGNDMKSEYFTLDYWHDAGIDEITSPPNDDNDNGDLCWDNGEPDGRSGLQGSMYQGYSNIVIDDFQCDEDWYVTGGHFRFVWNSGYSTGNLEKVRVYFFEETGNCEPSVDEYAIIEVTDFEEYATGNYYFSRPEIAVDVEFDEVELPAGLWWVGFQPDGVDEDIAYLLTAEDHGCSVMADLPYWGYPRWSSSQDIWDEEYDLSWKLFCLCCGPPSCNYIPLGIEDINATVKNYGTFPEMDLTCYAEIYEYITDPYYGTLVYEDNITDIDLVEPLGGEEMLEFEEFDFSMEGRYGLYLSMPAPNDDQPKNNKFRLGLCVDNTGPISTYELDPPYPDGENGWYVSDVEVTLEAYDPYVNDVSSGVKEIKYQINGGPVETISGSEAYFLITDDGDDILVEYWAIDWVGNIETPKKTFTIDIDQTVPEVDLAYEVGGNKLQGWMFTFTATATDKTSGMERVEFYLNEVWQETVTGSGPEYQWSFIYHGGLNIIVKAKGFDKAGNWAYDDVYPEKITYDQNSQQQSQSSKSSKAIHKSVKKLLIT